MNCRDSESLILAERDGALTKPQLAALSDHVAACPACAKLRANLVPALATYQNGLRAVAAPDADEAWRELQNRLRAPDRREKKRPLAPVIWFSASLAAAAAFAFAFIVTRPAAPVIIEAESMAALPAPPPPLHDPSFIAGADYVEAGDPDASVLVFVDKESGWLVVWAADSDTATSG
jgi:anti-sigma factor RsiW